MTTFACRPGCGACCIALSISSPIPGMPHGKAAGVRCVQLTDDNHCRLFGQPDRPAVCVNLRPSAEMCGETREEALLYLERLELLTRPNPLCYNRIVMSPKILVAGSFIFWFHSYDARYENRASVHVGKGSQDDTNDAKIWLEPTIEVARTGRVLKQQELRQALKIVEQNRDYLLEQWHEFKGRGS